MILNSKNNNFSKLAWSDVREEVHGVNPELAILIDELELSPEYAIYKAIYPYGSEILQKGKMHFPNEHGNLIPLTNSELPKEVQEDLGYNFGSNPISLVLENTIEVFANLGDRILPLYGLVEPGTLFGTWLVLNQQPSNCQILLWDITAGVRSILAVQNIYEKQSNTNLKKTYHVQSDKPSSLYDQWYMFKEILNHPSFGEPIKSSLLFFGKKWFEHMDDPAWAKFYLHLYESAFINSDFWRNQFMCDMLFSVIQHKRNIRPSPYISSIVKHLFSIGIGAVPGFAPAIDNMAAPIDRLTHAYSEVYKVKGYPPTFLIPKHFNMHDLESRPVYYSLNFPTSVEFSQKSRQKSSLINDLCEIRSLLETYLQEILYGSHNVEQAPLHMVANDVHYRCFHADFKQFHNIHDTLLIPKEDKSFPAITENTPFPANNSFFRACVRISHDLGDE